MMILKEAWFMVRSDFRGDKLKLLWAFLFSLIFMGYLAVMTGMTLDAALGNHQPAVVADFLLLSLTPLLGFIFSRRRMKYFSEDTYTKMLAYLRSLPIPVEVILCKRRLQAIYAFSLNGVLFFGILYAASTNVRNELQIPSYIAFSLSWIGYGLLLAGLYIFIEFLFSGKAYFWLTLLLALLSLALALLIKLAGGNVFHYSLSVSKEWGLLSPIMWGSLLFGWITVRIFSTWTLHRLERRNLL